MEDTQLLESREHVANQDGLQKPKLVKIRDQPRKKFAMDKWVVKRKKRTQKILVKRLSPSARIPTKKSLQAAGFDIAAPIPVYVPPLSSRVIGTKIALQIPNGYYGRIAARSGLAKDHQLTVLGGVVDSDYRGEIKVILMNLGSYPVDLPEHSRIAQMIIEKVHEDHSMEETNTLDDTKRNDGGLGSSGVTTP